MSLVDLVSDNTTQVFNLVFVLWSEAARVPCVGLYIYIYIYSRVCVPSESWEYLPLFFQSTL